ncbi:hypothetical protein OPT61_g4799 [Boeremia exigua]|uniref:Uncharacterized protein n=1 Tax=Boeremia exigua TaxID=749465 RepID=A0ACC2ICR6_9PLEO|nr:hypothetical protein OPT61_g4799 [Boeremia exigua]
MLNRSSDLTRMKLGFIYRSICQYQPDLKWHDADNDTLGLVRVLDVAKEMSLQWLDATSLEVGRVASPLAAPSIATSLGAWPMELDDNRQRLLECIERNLVIINDVLYPDRAFYEHMLRDDYAMLEDMQLTLGDEAMSDDQQATYDGPRATSNSPPATLNVPRSTSLQPTLPETPALRRSSRKTRAVDFANYFVIDNSDDDDFTPNDDHVQSEHTPRWAVNFANSFNSDDEDFTSDDDYSVVDNSNDEDFTSDDDDSVVDNSNGEDFTSGNHDGQSEHTPHCVSRSSTSKTVKGPVPASGLAARMAALPAISPVPLLSAQKGYMAVSCPKDHPLSTLEIKRQCSVLRLKLANFPFRIDYRDNTLTLIQVTDFVVGWPKQSGRKPFSPYKSTIDEVKSSIRSFDWKGKDRFQHIPIQLLRPWAMSRGAERLIDLLADICQKYAAAVDSSHFHGSQNIG